jgi:hypothetical protein
MTAHQTTSCLMVYGNTLERSGIKLGAKKQEEAGPRYKMVGDTKIFVSSVTGDLWKSRYDAAVEDRKPVP